ncbi:MAG: TonB-dependent receptor, partial [Bryobacterales bacterium]|nr:TonB-dependent receptor [Bryobacterales bacterium]
IPQTGDANIGAAVALQNFYYAGYLQDDIRLSSKLTINLGLRYETEAPYTERYNQINSFDFNIASPLRAAQYPNLTGGLVFAGPGNRTTFRSDKNNFAPRFGFAYSAMKKTVLRGGLGVFYSPLEVSGSDTGFSPSDGFSSATVYLGTLDGVRPFRNIGNPFPEGLTKPVGNTLGAATFLGQATSVWMNSPTTPIVYQWNFDIQRELPGSFLLDLAYTASHGSHLTQNRDFNALVPSFLSLGTGLQTLVDNPFGSQVTTGPLAQPRIARRQTLLPYPHFGSIFVINDTSGNSTYHATNVKLEKRYKQGVGFLFAYTWAKLISDVRNGLPTLDNGQNAGLNPGVQNWHDLRSERSISELDVAHTFTLSYVAELPFGKNKKFLNTLTGPAGKIIEGWQLSGITAWRSGFPLNFSAPITGGGNRPNSTGRSAKIEDHQSRGASLQRWFDTTAFTIPAPFTFGNVGRNISDVRGPSQFNWDLSLSKTTAIRERLSLQFRAESFNMLNRPNFFLPVTNVVNVQFGQINTSNGNPRINQLALKLIF